MEELVQLIDDLTDTFRGYLEALPKTERRVFLAMADLWQSSSTGEIAARSRHGRTYRLDHARAARRTRSRGHLGREWQEAAVRSCGTPILCIYYQLRRQT